MQLTSTFPIFALLNLALGASHRHLHRHTQREENGCSNPPPTTDSLDEIPDNLDEIPAGNWGPWPGSIRTSAYYVNWAIYGRQFFPYELNTEYITHLFYAFADINNVTGEVYLTDLWADAQIKFPGHESNTTTVDEVAGQDNSTAAAPVNNLYGNLEQLYLLKKQNRNLKTMLSIGGWTYSPHFAPGTDTEEKRELFASSAVKLLEDYGLDGIDVDWEYPESDSEASNFVDLLSKIRENLDQAEKKRSHPTKFYLAAAVPAGPTRYTQLDIPGMAQALDFWNLMAYDYAGSFSDFTAHQSNVFSDTTDPNATPFNTAQAVQHYLTHGVKSSELLLGIPAYGRAFAHTRGVGQPYNGTGSGSWEDGVWDYKALPLPGCVEENDLSIIASYCYDKANQTFISYDTPEIVAEKAKWAQSLGLGGGMWWETSADRPIGQGNLIEAFVESSGGRGSLKQESNCLEYPESQYDNIRN